MSRVEAATALILEVFRLKRRADGRRRRPHPRLGLTSATLAGAGCRGAGGPAAHGGGGGPAPWADPAGGSPAGDRAGSGRVRGARTQTGPSPGRPGGADGDRAARLRGGQERQAAWAERIAEGCARPPPSARRRPCSGACAPRWSGMRSTARGGGVMSDVVLINSFRGRPRGRGGGDRLLGAGGRASAPPAGLHRHAAAPGRGARRPLPARQRRHLALGRGFSGGDGRPRLPGPGRAGDGALPAPSGSLRGDLHLRGAAGGASGSRAHLERRVSGVRRHVQPSDTSMPSSSSGGSARRSGWRASHPRPASASCAGTTPQGRRGRGGRGEPPARAGPRPGPSGLD